MSNMKVRADLAPLLVLTKLFWILSSDYSALADSIMGTKAVSVWRGLNSNLTSLTESKSTGDCCHDKGMFILAAGRRPLILRTARHTDLYLYIPCKSLRILPKNKP